MKNWKRRNALRVEPTDTRSPIRRLLEDGTCDIPGRIYVEYDQQWRTLWKAQKIGYLDADQNITEAGRNFLASASR